MVGRSRGTTFERDRSYSFIDTLGLSACRTHLDLHLSCAPDFGFLKPIDDVGTDCLLGHLACWHSQYSTSYEILRRSSRRRRQSRSIMSANANGGETPIANGTEIVVAAPDAANDSNADDSEEDENNGVMQSLPPSHILEDGRFIYLPPPDARERSKFFERSIARHGLLEADMEGKSIMINDEADDKKKDGDDDDGDKTTPKVHPLALASAQLHTNGLSELNRAINLATLVQSGEFFGLSNIVDPSLEVTVAGGSGQVAGSQVVGAPAPTAEAIAGKQQEDEVKSSYVLKRKRAQFQRSSVILERHEKRLRAAIKAQRIMDRRLFQLRQQWKLVAPEHGTRARLHATRPTEVIAIDIDVYDRDRVGGGSQALKKQSLAGRLASRVPRFATIELQDDLKLEDVPDDDNDDEDKDKMDVDGSDDAAKGGELGNNNELSKWTRAEPFSVADPTLGRINENFDPSKVPMLNLQLQIQKSSTGFLQSLCLEPMTTLSVAQGEATSYASDEQVLISLQHSLFCASLFESIRSELDPPGVSGSQSGTGNGPGSNFLSLRANRTHVAWLSCESEENFVPPPSMNVAGDLGKGLAPLCVLYCHEGEVSVQLDSEYTLCVRLVEADVDDGSTATDQTSPVQAEVGASGSQSPEQLHTLCRALLLHAQDVYHRHSLYLRDRARKKREEEKAKGDGPRGLARIKKEDIPDKASILQSCVSLGAKMLFEQRIRKALVVSCEYDDVLEDRFSSFAFFWRTN